MAGLHRAFNMLTLIVVLGEWNIHMVIVKVMWPRILKNEAFMKQWGQDTLGSVGLDCLTFHALFTLLYLLSKWLLTGTTRNSVCVYVWVWVCVWERDSNRQIDRKTGSFHKLVNQAFKSATYRKLIKGTFFFSQKDFVFLVFVSPTFSKSLLCQID